jgi:cytochrome b561
VTPSRYTSLVRGALSLALVVSLLAGTSARADPSAVLLVPRLTLQVDASGGATPAEPSLNFDDLLPPAPPSAVDLKLESDIQTRRTLLQIHQALGIATVVLMVTTLVLGQINYDNIYGNGFKNDTSYLGVHEGFAIATTTTFVAGGLLALLAPSSMKHPSSSGGVDTITIHKWSMLVAAVGFATQIVLGVVAESQRNTQPAAAKDLATAHLVTGYVTGAALFTGTAVLFFP